MEEKNKGEEATSKASDPKNEENDLRTSIVALKSSYERETERARRFEAQLADVERKLKETKEEKDKLAREKVKSNPEELERWQKDREAEIRQEVGNELEKWKTEATTLKGQNKELTVTNKVFAIAATQFNDDCHDDVKGKIRQFCDLDDNGQVVVKDDNGKIRYSKTNPSVPMGAEEFVQELAANKPSWAKSNVTPGTKQPGFKASTNTNGSIKPPPSGFEGWSQADKQKWMTENRDAARAYVKTLNFL